MASAHSNWLLAVEEQEKAYADAQGLNDPEPSSPQPSTSKGTVNQDEKFGKDMASLLLQLSPSDLKNSDFEGISLEKVQSIQAYNDDISALPNFDDFNLRPDVKKGVTAMGLKDLQGLQTALPIVFENPTLHYLLEGPSRCRTTTALCMLLLHRANESLDHPHVLCLSPDSNSTDGILKTIKEMGKFGSVTVFESDGPVTKSTKLSSHVLISTYGKVSDWVFRKHCFDLSKITTLVIDGLDKIALNEDAQDQIKRINKYLPDSCQKIFFTKSHVSLLEFFEDVLQKFTVLKFSGNNSLFDKVVQYYLECAVSEDKFKVVAAFHRSIMTGCAFVFCRTRQTVVWLADKLNKSGYQVAFVHGEMSPTRKTSIAHRIRQNKEKMVILTDDFLTPKGLELDQSVLVINFDLPILSPVKVDLDVCANRVARVVKAGGEAMIINLVDDKTLFGLYNISKHFLCPIIKMKVEDISRFGLHGEA